MNQNLNTREAERKVFISFHEDGLIDLFLCFMMLISILSSTLSYIGVADVVRIIIYVPLMIVLGPIMYMQGKKYFTFPRLGYVKLAGKRTKYRLAIFVVTTSVLLTLLLMTIINNSGELNSNVLGMNEEVWSTLFMTLIILGVFFLIAVLMGIKRFYILGIIVAVSEPLYMIINNYTEIGNASLLAYGIPALFLLISGILMLRQFVLKYPVNDSVNIADNESA